MSVIDLSKHAQDQRLIQELARDRDTMRLQRNMLGQALGELLVAIGAMTETEVNGPTLVGVTHRAIEILKNQQPEFDRIEGRDPDRTTGYAPVGEGETLLVDPVQFEKDANPLITVDGETDNVTTAFMDNDGEKRTII